MAVISALGPQAITLELPYSGKFSERNIFGNLNEAVISVIKFWNVATCYYVATELL